MSRHIIHIIAKFIIRIFKKQFYSFTTMVIGLINKFLFQGDHTPQYNMNTPTPSKNKKPCKNSKIETPGFTPATDKCSMNKQQNKEYVIILGTN